MSLDNIVIDSPFHKDYSTLMYGRYVMKGSNRLVKQVLTLMDSMSEVMATLINEASAYLGKSINYGYVREYVGAYSHLPPSIQGLNIKGKDAYTGDPISMIMLHSDLIEKYIQTKGKDLQVKVAYYYTITHEMFHAYLGLGEYKTYSSLVNFFKHMSDLSYGELKIFYNRLTKYAQGMLKGFLEKPYDGAKIGSHINLEALLTYIEEVISANSASGKMSAKITILLSKLKSAKSGDEQKEIAGEIEETMADLNEESTNHEESQASSNDTNKSESSEAKTDSENSSESSPDTSSESSE